MCLTPDTVESYNNWAKLRLDFAILALPRSATTWASAWLTTDTSICWHDPIAHSTPGEMDLRPSSARYRGISCTGSWLFDWQPPERTLILERPVAEINASLKKLGLPAIPVGMLMQFKLLEGRRVDYRALFDERAREIWSFLLPDIPFNEERHQALCGMVINPAMEIPASMARVMKELRDESNAGNP